MEPLDAQLDELQDDALMLLFAQGEAGAARRRCVNKPLAEDRGAGI